MKSKQLSKKLSVNKETIANLYDRDMMKIKGGVIKSGETDCITCVTIFPCTTYEIPCHSTPITNCMC